MFPASLIRAILAITFFWMISAAGLSQTQESVPSDSLQSDTTLALLDFTELNPDSSKQTGTFKPWLLPFGIAAATGTAIFLLFSVRSR